MYENAVLVNASSSVILTGLHTSRYYTCGTGSSGVVESRPTA